MRKAAIASFFNRTTRQITLARINIPTGSGAKAQGFTIACHDYAWDNHFTHWAQPMLNDDKGRWLIYACEGRSQRVFIEYMPNREAAEMKLVHRA